MKNNIQISYIIPIKDTKNDKAIIKNYDKEHGAVKDINWIIENAVNCSEKKWQIKKEYLPVVQNTIAGCRIAHDDADYFKLWNGWVFVDFDNLNNAETLIKNWHKELCKIPIYFCSQLSASKKGIHLFFNIVPTLHSMEEYYNYCAICYNEVWKCLNEELKQYIIEQDRQQNEILDHHNIYHEHLFKIASNKFYVNENFDIDLGEEFAEFYKDEIDTFIKSKVRKSYNTKQKNINGDTTKTEKFEFIKSDVPSEIKLMSDPNIVWSHNMRYSLYVTLRYFYDEQTAKKLCYEVSILNKKSDTSNEKILSDISGYKFDEKTNYCNKNICRELVEVYGFDIYTKQEEENVVSNYVKIQLKDGHYFSDILDEVLINLGDITIIECAAGRGKTNAMKTLNNVIITQPYQSIIENKFNNTDFECIYDYFHLEKQENKICCTPDKLINFDNDLISNIEYVVIDECHTIFTNANFRLETMSKLVSKVKELCKLGKKIILMTGTTFREFDLFENYNLKFIRIETKPLHRKSIKIQYVTNDKVMQQRIFNDIDYYVKNGYKIIIPFNDGDNRYNDMINTFKTKFNVGEIESTYFKKSNKENELNKQIIENGNIDNVDVVFASLYMGEGLDINYNGKVVVLFLKIDTAQYIEQISARFRQNDIECVMYLNRKFDAKNKAHRYYNITDSYDDILASNTITEDIKNELTNIFQKHKDEKRYNEILNEYLKVYPFIDRMNFNINEDSLKLYEIAKSSMSYFKQLSVIIIKLQLYGFKVRFQKTDKDEKDAKEIAKIIKGSRKYRKQKEYEKAVELLQNLKEKDLIDIHTTYKTKDKMLKFVKELYSNGVTFEDSIKIGLSICDDNAVKWSEMDNIKSYVEYMIQVDVNNKINIINKGLVNAMLNYDNSEMSYYNWQNKIEEWNNKLCLIENVKETKEEMSAILKKIIDVHLITHKTKNDISIKVRNYGKILDDYFLQ